MIFAGKRPGWARRLKPSDFIATAVLLTITLAIPFIAYDQSRGAFPDGNSALMRSNIDAARSTVASSISP